jgi:genome maintenance exonuclease 1
MILNLSKFEYNDLKNIDRTSGRVYVDPDGNELPSVTTILSATTDKSFLIDWRKRIGDKEADRQVKIASDVGTLMHESVERHILGVDREKGKNYIHRLAHSMADRIIENGLSNVNEIWGVEVALYYPGLYAGKSDLVGVYDGLPSIMDHKNAKTVKKEEYVEGYYIQGAAYAMAHNHLYETNIRQVVLFMAGRDDQTYKTYIINGERFDHYTNMWIEKMDQYYNAE